MAENFFTDNLDLQRYLKKIDLGEVVGILEDGYRYHEEHAAAPRNYADAMDNYRLMLEVVGDISHIPNLQEILKKAAREDLRQTLVRSIQRLRMR